MTDDGVVLGGDGGAARTFVGGVLGCRSHLNVRGEFRVDRYTRDRVGCERGGTTLSEGMCESHGIASMRLGKKGMCARCGDLAELWSRSTGVIARGGATPITVSWGAGAGVMDYGGGLSAGIMDYGGGLFAGIMEYGRNCN